MYENIKLFRIVLKKTLHVKNYLFIIQFYLKDVNKGFKKSNSVTSCVIIFYIQYHIHKK